MGTEVHSNMQLPGYYSLRNLNDNTGNVGWPLHRENRNSGQYNDLFLTRLEMGYNKEQMRQTIMKHDSIFRHQLQELHRLYRIQRDMMNEVQSEEGNRHLIPVATSQLNPFSCGFIMSEDEQKRWHTSESHLLDLNSIHSQFSPLKGNVLQSGFYLTQNGLKLKNCESLESQPNKVQTRLFDLECPAEEYINNEEGGRGVSAVSGLESYHLKRSAEFCQEPRKARERGISLNNLDLEAERRQNGWFSNKFENGQTRSNGSFFHPKDLHTPFKSVQVETTKAQSAVFLLSDQNKRETFRKRKLFGVEIPEKSDGASAVTSHALDPLSVHSRSDAADSEMLSCSSRIKFSGNLSQNLLGNPGSRTFGQLNTSSTALMQDHDIIRGKLLVDNNSRSLPSLKAEVSAQNDFYFCCPSDSKESQGCCPLVGFCNQNGISESKFASKPLPWMMEAKSAVDLNMGAMAMDSYQNEEISQSDFVSVNGSIKQNSNGGLSWLRATTRPCNAKPIKEVEGSHQVNLDSLQNCFQQFIDKTAMRIQDSLSETCVDDPKHRKSETSCSSSSTKLLGFSISENIFRDLPLPNSPLKPGSPASAIDGHDPLPPKCGQQCLVEGLVADKRSVNQNADVRHIDLNLCVIEEGIEEDFQSTSSSVRTNVRIATIDLEMPVTSSCESLESNLTKPSNLLNNEISESHQGLLSVSAAAEALVAISSSSSCVINLQQNAGSHELEISASDSFNWFAEIVTSCWSDTENDVVGSSNGDGIDIFEFMTLNLTETKVEECCYKPQVEEKKKSEDTLPRRPRRGRARRGKQQRKDFQRDVLPNLTSLSRDEVTEDFQMIEGLIRAIGGSWQSSLTQKNNAKGSTGRGRKRAAGGSEECSNQFQQMKTGLEERSLTGWGKRTRRLPRLRCLISSPSLL